MTARRPATTAAAAAALDDERPGLARRDSRNRGGLSWDGPPTPLSARRLMPAFPVDVLPGWVADMVGAVTEFHQTPPDLAGSIALAVLSAAAGGRVAVEVRPGWVEPVNLFVVVALPPGSRKSPVFKTLSAPLLRAEKALCQQTWPLIEQAEIELRIARTASEKTAKAAENAWAAEVRAEAMADALDAAAAVRQITVPLLPQLVADDITPEAAASLLAEQGGRLAVLSDEGGIFATLAGRYSGTPNLEVFLKGHAGTLLRVNRKSREPEHIEAPALTLGLAVQPDVLLDIARLPGFRGRGLLARILFSLPTNTVGRRRVGPLPPSPDIVEAYSDRLSAIVIDLHRLDEPAVLPLSRSAQERVLQFEAELEPQLAPGAALGHITDWASKLVGATTRLAGLLHVAEAGVDAALSGAIDSRTIDAGTRLGTYYLTHALAVFDYMGADPLVEDARHLVDWIGRRGQPAFTRREAYAPNRSRFAKPADLDPALALLVDHGFIQPLEAPARGSGGGRPASPRFAVHPDVLDTQRTERTQPGAAPWTT